MTRFRMKAIPVSSGFLDPKRYQEAIDNFLDAAAENVRIDEGVTTQTFHHKVTFVIEVTKDGRLIYTTDKPYGYLDRGTSVRYATMTRDFIPKTSPNTIASGPGQGGLAYVSKKHPRPGIQARNFTKTIIKKWQGKWPDLFLRMQKTAASH